MDSVVVGIDVAKAGLDVHVLPAGEAFAVGRDAAGIDELIARLRPLAPALVAVAATGGLESVVAASLGAAGLPVVVVNPAQVRAFAQALGKRAKSDPIDAAVIARFALATRPTIRPLADQETTALADLIARRRQIIQMPNPREDWGGRAAREAGVEADDEEHPAPQEGAAEGALGHRSRDPPWTGDTVRGSSVWREKEDLLASVPGVGTTIARTLIAGLPELGRLDRRQLATLAGLAPFTGQSGQWRVKACIAAGRASVRSPLFMGAMVAVKHDPILKAFHERLIAAGKPRMVALIAVARKLLTILNAIVRDPKPWQTAWQPRQSLPAPIRPFGSAARRSGAADDAIPAAPVRQPVMASAATPSISAEAVDCFAFSSQ